MEANNRIIDIIEDHESIVNCISSIVLSINDGLEPPRHIPLLHDSLVSDWLGVICEELSRKHVKKT